MKEKTKKILKGAGITLGAVALLTLGIAVGACSAKAGTKQQTAITTPVAKSLIQRPKKAEELTDLTGTKWVFNETITRLTPNNYNYYVDFRSDGKDYRSFIVLNGSSSVVATYNLCYGLKGTNKTDVTYTYFNNAWRANSYKTIEITGGDDVTNSTFIEWLEENATLIQEEDSSLFENKEKLVLAASYDFRRWFGNVDPTTGAIQYKLPTGASLVSVRVGGLEWESLGNERIYNCIEFTLQPLNASNALAVSDNLAKTAESLYGEKYTDFCMLSGVYYSYQSGYDGIYTTITDSALPSVDYRDRIYSMPMVSAQLDGTANNVNALDIRNCVIPSIYRSFGIIDDSGVIFSTNGYSSVTTRQLLGMDFSSVVNYSEGTASAFSLLTQAFGSVAGLLAVQVLPNITLGLLLFLPLIGAVIVLVIKAVKK